MFRLAKLFQIPESRSKMAFGFTEVSHKLVSFALENSAPLNPQKLTLRKKMTQKK